MRIRDLDVYRRAFRCAVDIGNVSKTWPKDELYNGLTDQIRRAARGICANLVEGLAKNGEAEQRRFLNMAVGSAREVQVWLEFAEAHAYISDSVYKAWTQEYDEIVRMLMGLMKRRET
jgi:four helix bundle protein